MGYKNKKGGSQRASQRGSQRTRGQGQHSKSRLRNSQRASRKQSRQSGLSRRRQPQNPLNLLADAAAHMNPLPVLPVPPPAPFVPLPPPVVAPLVIPDFIRYVPTMPDGRMLDATNADVVPGQGNIVIPIPGNTPHPPGPIPAGLPTNTARGASKTVFFHANSDVAYITSTLAQMRNTVTNVHFKEELLLTQIENFLFPNLILGAYHVGGENQERIQAYRQANPANIFIYKKRKVRESTGDSPGIIPFIIQSIFSLSNDRLDQPVPLSFTNLDIKPANIGILPDGTFIYLDNGSIMMYPVPHKFRGYYERSALIIALCNLRRVLTNPELHAIRGILSRAQLYETFNKQLSDEDQTYITEYARQFFIAQGLPLTAENDVLFPIEVMTHYCKMLDTNLSENKYKEKFREIVTFNGLNRL
jgi:hypothetical protein